jgi:hypothetical protein
MTQAEIQQLVDSKIEDMIDALFVQVHQKAQTVDGHINPEQQEELEDIKALLSKLVTAQVVQNLPPSK